MEGTYCELSNSEAELVEGDMESIDRGQLFYLYVCVSEDDAEGQAQNNKLQHPLPFIYRQKHYALLSFVKNDA